VQHKDKASIRALGSKKTHALESKQTPALGLKQTHALESKQTPALGLKQTHALESKQTPAQLLGCRVINGPTRARV
jgi:hypothetical protein